MNKGGKGILSKGTVRAGGRLWGTVGDSEALVCPAHSVDWPEGCRSVLKM